MLVCPAKAGVFSGRQSHQGKSQNPVAWIVRRKETESREPIDKAIEGWRASHRAVMNQRMRSLETESRRPSLSSWGEGSMDGRRLTEADHSGGVTATARWQGCAKQLEKPYSPRREIGGAGNRITGPTGKSGTGERVAEGSAVAGKQSNVCGAKGPYCL